MIERRFTSDELQTLGRLVQWGQGDKLNDELRASGFRLDGAKTGYVSERIDHPDGSVTFRQWAIDSLEPAD